MAVWSEEKADELRVNVADTDTKIVAGMDGLLEVATMKGTEILVTAVVGMIGIRPTIEAIKAGKDIALANKETLVTAGHIIMPLAKKMGVSILPVDSEHSAIFQSLQGNDHGALHKILLTASGGPFRGKKSEELMEIKVEDALKHPNWSMGRKITIDSSTMVNKGLEVIEANWLFNVDVDQVQVVVQPQSIIHSMVEYVDGAIIAELGTPDMKLPIQYALYYPERRFLPGDRVDFWTLGKLEFEKPDTDTFYGLELAYEAGRKAVREHYQRLGIDAKVEMTERPGWYRSHVKVQGNPLISVIIPNKDHTDDLELCLFSMTRKSTYRNYEILIVENNSEKEETFEYYKKLPDRYPKARVLTWEKEFNYSAINNFAAKEAKGEYLLFLNNDVEILTPDWMEEMLQNCQQEDVAVVGAKLYYPDDTIQHAGVVLGLGGIAGHIMCRASREDPGYFGRMISVQEISAVTAACMMVKKSDFDAVGGLDETFQVAFNDIDLCMKFRAAGKKIIFTPYAELYHYESKSRGLEDTPEKQFRFDKEVKRFQEKWAQQLEMGDPYYSPNLSVTEGDCSLRED